MTECLPAGPAWFFHRREGRRRLGVCQAEAGALRMWDIGEVDELDLLARGGLDAPALRRAENTSRPSRRSSWSPGSRSSTM